MLKRDYDGVPSCLLDPAAFRRLCVETCLCILKQRALAPAAFRRLCVETMPSLVKAAVCNFQPPSGGCVLKLYLMSIRYNSHVQPPSGGCVLKLRYLMTYFTSRRPAAFRRLCVETFGLSSSLGLSSSSRLQAAVC